MITLLYHKRKSVRLTARLFADLMGLLLVVLVILSLLRWGDTAADLKELGSTNRATLIDLICEPLSPDGLRRTTVLLTELGFTEGEIMSYWRGIYKSTSVSLAKLNAHPNECPP